MLDRGTIRQAIIGVVCNLLVIDSGLNEGWSTPIIPKFNNKDPLEVTTDQIAWVVNLMYVGVGLGSIVPFFLMDRIGRKGTLLFAALPKIGSWILIGLAGTVPQIFIGRILAGVGCGITYAVMPMYIGEVTSKRTRGILGTLMAVVLNIGVFISYAIGLFVSRFTMAMAVVGIPAVFLATFAWLPESSVFLTRKNKLESAARMLQWSLGKENVDEELEEIKRIVAVDEQYKEKSVLDTWKDIVLKRQHRRAFQIALILLTALSLTGAAPILAYQSYILEQGNFEISIELAIIITGSMIVLAGATCVVLVRLTGKRLLLLISTPICVLALSTMASFFTLRAYGFDVSGFEWVPMVFLVIYVFGYGLALNPVPLAYVGEIFHCDVKVPAAIFCALYYALTTTAVVKFYQVVEESYGTHAPIWIFTMITILVWALIYRYVPETEGKTLAEIQIELRQKN